MPELRHGSESRWPLVVVAGPTASGKSSLAMALARRFGGEVVSCDSVAVYRGLEIGSAKPGLEARREIAHHGLDLLQPTEPSTAGDYARAARSALNEIRGRHRLPVIAGGTGLYLRATLAGLAPAPPRNEALRARLRRTAERRGPVALHRLLQRVDPRAASAVHAHDVPKVVRSIEVTLLARQPQTEQWQGGRSPLRGFRMLQFGLDPGRPALYARINERAAAMFERGLVQEARSLALAFGEDAVALHALGYVQALAVARGELGEAEAIAQTQQGHRHYAKRQMTWFRRDPCLEWLHGFGDEPEIVAQAERRVRQFLASGEGGGQHDDGCAHG